jgi:hypothetical protein
MSPDPLGGHLEDPQTLNKYAYVRNSPLTLTDPTGMDFALTGCDSSDLLHCQRNNDTGQYESGSYSKDSNGKLSFTTTQIGNNPDGSGGLIDKTTGTGAYTGTFDGKSVSLTDSAGNTHTGSWIQGTDPVKGISGGGDLGDRFQFKFMDHGAGQTLNFEWNFNGTQALAAAILQKAGYQYFKFGLDLGYDEYRLPAQGRNSTHFLMQQSPNFTLPSASGKGHSGEYFPGVQHTVCDWMGLC